jgi:hypothetical protein
MTAAPSDLSTSLVTRGESGLLALVTFAALRV